MKASSDDSYITFQRPPRKALEAVRPFTSIQEETMNSKRAGVVILILAALVAVAAAQTGEGRKFGVLAPLQVGQMIALKEGADGYQISAVLGVQQTHKVVEVGSDYVAVVEIGGLTETRIPVYSIRCVLRTRVGVP
jgi:hypothetical protein